jgi:hypothetical protein
LGGLIAHAIAGHHGGLADDLLTSDPDSRLARMGLTLDAIVAAAEKDGLTLPTRAAGAWIETRSARPPCGHGPRSLPSRGRGSKMLSAWRVGHPAGSLVSARETSRPTSLVMGDPPVQSGRSTPREPDDQAPGGHPLLPHVTHLGR